MEKLKKYAPVLFSPTFWGLTLGALLKIIVFYGLFDEGVIDIVSNWVLAVTGVNIVWKGAKKVGDN